MDEKYVKLLRTFHDSRFRIPVYFGMGSLGGYWLVAQQPFNMRLHWLVDVYRKKEDVMNSWRRIAVYDMYSKQFLSHDLPYNMTGTNSKILDQFKYLKQKKKL